ncbi:type 1 fimbrial protein [Aeromonas hydrophila]|nr:type 1 fimbrial protein [Aeromonas hydrophila]
MNIKMSAISASVLLMLAGGAMADEYEIKFQGKVVTDSCVITGNGNGLLFELQPVLASKLSNSSDRHNVKIDNSFAKVVCEGEAKGVSVHWSPDINTIKSAYVNTPAIVPEEDGDYAKGTYVYAYSRVTNSEGTLVTTPVGDSKKIQPKMVEANGYFEAPITIAGAYVTAKDSEGKFETVTPGSVMASAPLVLSYE